MKIGIKDRNILYCSSFRSHRAHRELVRLAAQRHCYINAVLWEESSQGQYTGPFPVDGIISHLGPGDVRLLNRTVGDVPHVTMHASSVATLGMPGVVSNHIAAGRMVAEHYLALGFTRFAAFVDKRLYDTFDRRIQGYTEPIVMAGFPPPELISLPQRSEGNYEETLVLFGEALKSMPLPLAIMAANDRVAIKLMESCRQNDLSIPAQVAVCGFDNDPIACDLAPVALSSVDTDPERQARDAFAMLLSLLEGRPQSAKPIIIEPKGLVVRRSSGLRAQESGTVAKAVAFIHEHVWEQDLSVPSVVDHIGVSRTTLFLAFKRSLSQTPLQYITDLRVTRAQELLRDTGKKLNEIRPECGFASDYQMYRAFKRTTGKSPSRFR